MAKEKEDLVEIPEGVEVAEAAEAAVEPSVSETPNRDKWFANLRAKYGEDKSDEDLFGLSMEKYDEEHESNKRYSEEGKHLWEVLSENPDLAGVYSEMFERGKDGHPELALRKLPPELKRVITDENYGDEAYLEDKKKSEEEAAAKAEREEKLQAMRAEAFDEVCQEDGITDPAQVLTQLQVVLENPCETKEQCKEQVRSFLKMVNYDDDVNAAEVRGRNANITERRKRNANATDGLVNIPSAAGVAANTVKRNPIADLANRREALKNL